MDSNDLKKQVDDLKLLIEVEQENYKTALQNQINFDTLKQMRLNIKALKSNLQIFLDQQSVEKTGELPEEPGQTG